MAEKFTQKLVDKFSQSDLPEGKQQVEIHDSYVKGLSIVRGKKSCSYFYAQQKKGLKRRRIKIGSTSQISLKDARNQAFELSESEPQTTLSELRNDFHYMTVRRYVNEVYAPANPDHYNLREFSCQFDDLILQKQIKDLKPADIEDWAQRRIRSNVLQTTFKKGRDIEFKVTDRRVKPETARRGYAVLRAIINWGVKRDHFPLNPIAKVSIKGEKARMGRGMAVAESSAYKIAIKTIENLRLKCFLTLLINTGARPREILTIKRSNIISNDPNPRVLVEASFAKTRRQRELRLNAEACNVLEEYMYSSFDKRPKNSEESDWLFFNPRTNTHVKCMSKTFQHWAGGFGDVDDLSKITLYSFRHTFAYELHQMASLATTRDMMGHASVSTTDIYLKGTSSEQRDAIDAFSLNSDRNLEMFKKLNPDFVDYELIDRTAEKLIKTGKMQLNKEEEPF